jgi:sugar O-acyltransferase (sialic acid O-acetyltransferase NeuD family)
MAGRRFIVVGAGGHGKVVVASIIAAGDEVIGILDDDASRHGQSVLGARVLGSVDAALIPGEAVVVLGVGSNRERRAIADRLAARYASVIHPSAIVHSSVNIGAGAVVFAGAVIQPDSVIGAHAIVNTSASIDHDNRIGAFVHIGPGVHLSGTVTVGDGTLVGIGSAVIPGMVIGEWATVGAGSAVVSNIGDRITVAGCPAKPLRKKG